MASSGASGDKYRSFVSDEENKSTEWRFGAPPNYDAVNKLFEEERTKIWPPGSLEEKVQNLLKTWEMELMHKANPKQYKVMDPDKCTFSVNGRKANSFEEVRKLGGSYNMFLQTSLPKNLRGYDSEKETLESSHKAFTTTFPRGFALEILRVYCGPPEIVYKFRHWAYMEGPYKGHAPTGERVELFGMGVIEVDEQTKIVRVEFFFDRGELLGGLMKGLSSDSSSEANRLSCPILKNVE